MPAGPVPCPGRGGTPFGQKISRGCGRRRSSQRELVFCGTASALGSARAAASASPLLCGAASVELLTLSCNFFAHAGHAAGPLLLGAPLLQLRQGGVAGRLDQHPAKRQHVAAQALLSSAASQTVKFEPGLSISRFAAHE